MAVLEIGPVDFKNGTKFHEGMVLNDDDLKGDTAKDFLKKNLELVLHGASRVITKGRAASVILDGLTIGAAVFLGGGIWKYFPDPGFDHFEESKDIVGDDDGEEV